MGIKTAIEWTDHTWSPWFGCSKVSPGCLNCYAAGWAHRFGKAWGRGTERPPTNQWDLPVRWNRQAERQYRAVAHSTPAGQPIPFRRPTVFPSSIDWLDEDVPAELLARFLQLIRSTPYITWLLLTKRPELWRERLNNPSLADLGGETFFMLGDWLGGKAPTNVWVGTSVEDQTRADVRIPALLRIPAVGRFLSVEPLLGPVDLRMMRSGGLLGEGEPWLDCLRGRAFDSYGDGTNTESIHWVIIGGESGHGARPCKVERIRSLVRQCKEADLKCFVKQLGAVVIETQCMCPGTLDGGPDCKVCGCRRFLCHPKGGDPAEWPEDLRVREFPEGLR